MSESNGVATMPAEAGDGMPAERGRLEIAQSYVQAAREGLAEAVGGGMGVVVRDGGGGNLQAICDLVMWVSAAETLDEFMVLQKGLLAAKAGYVLMQREVSEVKRVNAIVDGVIESWMLANGQLRK